MADVNTWSETAASNSAAAPDGFPENTNPAAVDDWGREVMGAVKRFADRVQPTLTSGGSANAQTLTFAVAPASLVAGDEYTFIAGFTNTAAMTLAVNTLPATAVERNGAALAGGEITAGQVITVYYDGTHFQIQSPPIVSITGPTQRLSAPLPGGGLSVTFTADYVSVATAIGGQSFTLANFNKSFSVTLTGAGGMDTGSAPINGFVSIYAIYNPTTGAAALLGTTASQATVYSGSNLPAGYTASGLLAIWPTDASRHLIPATLVDRELYFQGTVTGASVLSGGTSAIATAISLSAVVPGAARKFYGAFTTTETSTIGANSFSTFGATNQLHEMFLPCLIAGENNQANGWLEIVTPSTAYYGSGHSTVQSGIQVLGYSL